MELVNIRAQPLIIWRCGAKAKENHLGTSQKRNVPDWPEGPQKSIELVSSKQAVQNLFESRWTFHSIISLWGTYKNYTAHMTVRPSVVV